MSIQCDNTWLAKLKEEDWLKEIYQKPEDECNSVLKAQNMFVEDGVLYKSVDGRKAQVVPQDETKAVFDCFHNGVFGGHAGWFKTFQMMQKYVFWPSMRNNVQKWVKKCFTCARHKKQRKSVPTLNPIVCTRPYELVGIDVFSISQTNKGGEFLNEIMQEIQKLTGVEQKFTVGHNPRENGVTERMNETLKGLLSKMSDGLSEWDQRLAYALFFYNSSPHSTTGESPFFMLHGADPNFPVCGTSTAVVSPYTVDLEGYKVELARGMNALHEIATERMQKQAEAMKRYYDKLHKVEKTRFELYDRVFVFNPNVSIDRDSTKLSSPWEGPSRITAMSDNSATVRFLGPQKLEKRVQVDYLRRIPPEVAEDEFYLYKPDKKVGRPKGPSKTAAQSAKKGRPQKRAVREEIGGKLTDYEQGCGCHRFKLELMPVKQPPTSKFWSATTPLEVARGAAVAETVTMDTVAKEQFYMGTSPVVLELRLAEPTDDQIVMALLKSIEECPKRKQAFVEAMHVPFKCTTTASSKKAAREIRIAERARATLDGGKELQTDETIVAGGRNATRFAAALAMNSKSAPTLAELRTFLASHFASSVKRVFIWLDLPNDNVVADLFINDFTEELKAAAAWKHVMFIVLPLRTPNFACRRSKAS
ncbi:gagpol and env protein precursor [Aphelenchoides avenae]|nr:gagpol and env protein precursor [Aphelenchus avenae]